MEATSIIYNELEERVNRGYGVVEDGAPRILALVPVSFTDPRLEYLIEELGMVVTTEIDLFWPDGRRAPNVEKSDDPYITLCAYLYDSKTRKLSERIQIIKETCKRLKIDGVLCRSHVGCRTIASDIIIIKDVIKKELGLPAILLESESFDPRYYNHGVFKRKMELFKMMLDYDIAKPATKKTD
jgi:benzoyl-CoA reductase/2-hydroxyglutaryl-CoA dehydratase subunit BcrC/BadD/HgdB